MGALAFLAFGVLGRETGLAEGWVGAAARRASLWTGPPAARWLGW